MKFIYSFILFISGAAAHADVNLTCTAVNSQEVRTIKIDTYAFIGGLKKVINCYRTDCSGQPAGIEYAVSKMTPTEKSYRFSKSTFWGLGYFNSSLEIEKQLLDNSLAGNSAQGYLETTDKEDNIIGTAGSSSRTTYVCRNNLK